MLFCTNTDIDFGKRIADIKRTNDTKMRKITRIAPGMMFFIPFVFLLCLPAEAQNKKPASKPAQTKSSQSPKSKASPAKPSVETSKSEAIVPEKEDNAKADSNSTPPNWITNITSFKDGIALPRFSHYYEATLGIGLSDKYPYVGFSYSYIPQKIGFNASLVKGISTTSVSLMLGPTYRINESGKGWQVFFGIGGTIAGSSAFAMQGGVRYAFDNGTLNHTESLSIMGGLQYINRDFIPTLGVSVIPATKKIEEWWGEKERRFPHHYTEAMASFGSGGFMLGTNYTYIPSKVGPYISGMIGDGLWTANLGGALRLSNSNASKVDVQLYQGVGLCNGDLGGETGFRFGFGGRDEGKFGWWSIVLGVNYSENYIGATAGLSWPIVGIAAVAVGMAAVGYFMSDVGSSPSTTTTSSPTPSDASGQSGYHDKKSTCKKCKGSGKCMSHGRNSSCFGTGICQFCDGAGWNSVGGNRVPCATCKNHDGKCKWCKGTGKCEACGGK